MNKHLNKWVYPLIVPIILIIIWTIAAKLVDNPSILPPVSDIVYHFTHAMDNFIGLGSLPRNIGFSLVRVLLGYSLGALIAIPLGLLMGYFRTMNSLFESFINLFKPVPPLAWQPLILGWFGVSSLATIFGLTYGKSFVLWDNYKISMIFLIAMGSFFPVVGNVMFGVKNVRKTLIESAKVLGASNKDIFFQVLLPSASPTILNGLRMGLATAWGCLVGAEMLPGSVSGVGYLITHAYELARIDLVITGIICIGVVGALLDGIFKFISQRYFSWESKVR
ncbi:ABC transporter permease [Miniphocaeibacter massiliensis]|uniref:ABC transporter permease n=1 Tax=Miniphocaeibacter massiliensis TaxID=2041841 RepID=UPI000C07140F|nr:ABC transporter permease [Miniphocaeibacter massiliensis]